MPKHYPINKAPASPESAEPGDVLPGTRLELPTAPAFWVALTCALAEPCGGCVGRNYPLSMPRKPGADEDCPSLAYPPLAASTSWDQACA